jgi:hypothetical protein
MLIKQILPQVVGEQCPLRDRLRVNASVIGWSEVRFKELIGIIPQPLLNSECFLDKLTGLWRYEFGIPYDIASQLVWGTHMWVPVDNLFATLSAACARLSVDKRAAYIARLADPNRHQAVIAEMIPAHKVAEVVPMAFEVIGLGAGNRSVDWAIGPLDGRTTILDVKQRNTDFIRQAERIGTAGADQEPDHDPALLFRSVEQKFVVADPDVRLQGAWICTAIKQEEQQLTNAFNDLNPGKVHFAIFGDWKRDVYLLARREADRQYLLDLFRVEPSSRFTFKAQ